MRTRFEKVLDDIRSRATSEAQKGKLFERLIKRYLAVDPLYMERFSNIWLWSEWAAEQLGFKGNDTGIDLVAEERDGGFCAIQCKCYAPETRITKPHLDSFISASDRAPFTARLVVDTGADWGRNAIETIQGRSLPCTILRFGDLAERPIDWPDLANDDPETLAFRQEPFTLKPHQQVAFDDVVRGFDKHDRGKLIMACGTGKTFTALRIAEELSGVNGRILYLVPSISLLQQSMREWATQRSVPHTYIGICSDVRAGRNDEDASLEELEIPVTTKSADISAALQKKRSDTMTVVFCTYHSLPIVQQAQSLGAPSFDLILCDEAHRTTGVERPEDRTSPFVLVHDAKQVLATKRLYMTATPRLYTEIAKAKASRHDIEVFSMDDSETYGPEFHRLPFSRAVEQDLLSDYKVVVLAISEQDVDATLQAHFAADGGEINITDAAKIVGCWRALQDPENKRVEGGIVRPLARAIAFTNTIEASKMLERYFDKVVQRAICLIPENKQPDAFNCEIRHVDGQHNALQRKSRIEWLKSSGEAPKESERQFGSFCRILSNARCLSEGIDVPALDAVLFMSPRNSHVDIVQAVGRAMRKAEGKSYGYIVLPIAVPADADPADILNNNERFATVWSILRALRSHDDRFDAEINKIDLNKNPTQRIIFNFNGTSSKGDSGSNSSELPFPPLELSPDAFYAMVVERCGDRKYWETWARDVADIFARLVNRIEKLLDNPKNTTLRQLFSDFHEEMRDSINDKISRENAIEMMAQHLITRPVFEAMFEHYDFSDKNPVAQALDALQNDFAEFGLESEIRNLKNFYESVRMRAQGIDNSDARQRVLMELYEKFFAIALKKDADRLGIVYTPVEVVDFILNSADYILRKEFGRSLTDSGVHILDPFTGTGIFLVRLLRSTLVQHGDLVRKYREELHANEIVLLAYYIATVHIEEALHGRIGGKYDPFTGIVLTDTFNLHTKRAGFAKDWLPANSDRAKRQQEMPIEVIVGNPPWSAKQQSVVDESPNVNYPELRQRITETYAALSTSANKAGLFDSYKMAIRWATDRIGDRGVIALVTNGSWIDGNADSGLRASLSKEFTSVYVLNLRGNSLTPGDKALQEGGNVFNVRVGVAITVFVRNPDVEHSDCNIFYFNFKNSMKRKDKLEALRSFESIAGVTDWQQIAPDDHNDWIGQRDPSFTKLYPIGSKLAKKGGSDETIFRMFTNGYYTGRDAHLYNFSADACFNNAKASINTYQKALHSVNTKSDIDGITKHHSTFLKWDTTLVGHLRKGKNTTLLRKNVRKAVYRPFVKQYVYADDVLAKRPAISRNAFPSSSIENRAICIPGIGSKRPFSAYMVDIMPDVQVLFNGQCFPRYQFSTKNSNVDSFTDLELQFEGGGLSITSRI